MYVAPEHLNAASDTVVDDSGGISIGSSISAATIYLS